jgi:Ca2+-binding EF-hand superfamily protein
VIDISGDNKVSRDELRRLMSNMKVKMTTHEIDTIFSAIDLDGSGEISLPEFRMEFKRISDNDINNLVALHRSKNGGNKP